MAGMINSDETNVINKVLMNVVACLEPNDNLKEHDYISNEGLLILLTKDEYDNLVNAMLKMNP